MCILIQDDKKGKWQSVTASIKIDVPHYCPAFEHQAYGADEQEAVSNLKTELNDILEAINTGVKNALTKMVIPTKTLSSLLARLSNYNDELGHTRLYYTGNFGSDNQVTIVVLDTRSSAGFKFKLRSNLLSLYTCDNAALSKGGSIDGKWKLLTLIYPSGNVTYNQCGVNTGPDTVATPMNLNGLLSFINGFNLANLDYVGDLLSKQEENT